MKKRILSLTLAASTALLMAGPVTGTMAFASQLKPGPGATEETEAQEGDAEAEEGEEDDLDALQYMGPGPVVMDDQMAANYVADLIDALYEDDYSDDTLEQCEEAKSAWDALSSAAKEMVLGDYADPDYFGRDTGDASLDDPRNADDIGENELLVVSVGTSFNHSRAADIKGIEDTLAEEYPDWSVRRAFMSQSIINHIYARNGELIDNLEQALERAVDNGVENLVIVPTMLIEGEQYVSMLDTIAEYGDQFETLEIADPLLGDPGDGSEDVNEDEQAVAEAVVDQAVKDSEYDSLADMAADGTALVLVGSGSEESAGISYDQVQAALRDLGYDNVFIGSVEGDPLEFAAGNVPDTINDSGYTNVILRPLMVTAGKQANYDMAGEDDDSWYNVFLETGYFDNITCQIEGIGRIPAIEELYVAHAEAAIDKAGVGTKLADGEYTVEFHTDGDMFHANDSVEEKCILTVKDGEMTVHVPLVSESIVELYVGTSQDAQKPGADLIEPTEETITYNDGDQEDVYAYDIPVPALNEEFDVAILGAKGDWYDHKVIVEGPLDEGTDVEDVEDNT